jgi:hypothetical protein
MPTLVSHGNYHNLFIDDCVNQCERKLEKQHSAELVIKRAAGFWKCSQGLDHDLHVIKKARAKPGATAL